MDRTGQHVANSVGIERLILDPPVLANTSSSKAVTTYTVLLHLVK